MVSWYVAHVFSKLLLLYLTANGLTPGSSSAATFTHKQYTKYKEQNIHSKTKEKVK